MRVGNFLPILLSSILNKQMPHEEADVGQPYACDAYFESLIQFLLDTGTIYVIYFQVTTSTSLCLHMWTVKVSFFLWLLTICSQEISDSLGITLNVK